MKTNNNDYIDGEAIAEAVTRPTMRFVPIKSDDQLDLQSLHRVRERWVVRVAGQSYCTQAQAGGDRGLSQQDGSHGLGGPLQRRGLSPAAGTTAKRSLMACT